MEKAFVHTRKLNGKPKRISGSQEEITSAEHCKGTTLTALKHRELIPGGEQKTWASSTLTLRDHSVLARVELPTTPAVWSLGVSPVDLNAVQMAIHIQLKETFFILWKEVNYWIKFIFNFFSCFPCNKTFDKSRNCQNRSDQGNCEDKYWNTSPPCTCIRLVSWETNIKEKQVLQRGLFAAYLTPSQVANVVLKQSPLCWGQGKC